MNIIEAINDRNLMGGFFTDPSTWGSWFSLLRAAYGLPPGPDDLAIYQRHTGRETWPEAPASELWIIVGRRSGKSFTSALIGVFEACFKKHTLAVGEVGHVIIIAPTRQQARIIHRYLAGFFNENPMLKRMILRETQWEIELTNRICITVLSGDFRSLRGFTSVAAICDELAFFMSEGSRPDYEILRALRPTLTTTGGPLICISSPYSQQGALYDAYRKYYGKEGDVLIWRAASRDMNPTLDEGMILKATEADPDAAAAEWEGMFRKDIEGFCSREAAEACIVPERYELPPIESVKYRAFCDPSGGSKDSMTLAVAHTENKIRVLDCIREVRPPFSPDQVVRDFADTLRLYRLHTVSGDRYSGEWCREKFREHGITYKPADKVKSDIFKELLPLVNGGQVELLDHKKLVSQLMGLERRTHRGGRDSIDHGPGAHDDLINAAAGALVGQSKKVNVGLWGEPADPRSSRRPMIEVAR